MEIPNWDFPGGEGAGIAKKVPSSQKLHLAPGQRQHHKQLFRMVHISSSTAVLVPELNEDLQEAVRERSSNVKFVLGP